MTTIVTALRVGRVSKNLAVKYRELARLLVPWYIGAKRALPWRSLRDPYRIWISEVMLQQTTVTAVIPYYERFLKKFPNVEALASAPLETVLEYWAGLGYYSRARSLHASAQKLAKLGAFPKTYLELLELPGFGPYTARAVSSLAFGETVGVVDGNVIRVLSRVLDLDLQWWKSVDREKIQVVADVMASNEDPSDLNQALMELGATICTPSSPSCMLCPWSKACLAREHDTISKRPISKPRRAMEFWTWEIDVVEMPSKGFLLVENDYAPFLKGHLVPPGKVKKHATRPREFDFKGTVTHHEIFARVNRITSSSSANITETRSKVWIPSHLLKSKVPSSLIRKALDLKAKV